MKRLKTINIILQGEKMKQYTKKISGVIALCLILIGGFSIQRINADSIVRERANILKEEIELQKSNDDSSFIIKGKNFTITDEEIVKKIKAYETKGEKNPKEAAVKHLVKRKVLLNKAVEMGYTVTEDEIDKQISLVKEAVTATENYSDYLDFINECGGEDAYWKDMRDTTRDTMIINKYLDYEKDEYYQENKDNQVQDDSNLFDGWNKRKAEIINDLVENQEITITDSKYKDIALTW